MSANNNFSTLVTSSTSPTPFLDLSQRGEPSPQDRPQTRTVFKKKTYVKSAKNVEQTHANQSGIVGRCDIQVP